MLSSKMIFGFSSTLISAMICCRKNVVLLGWHPSPSIFGEDYSKTGLCHISLKIDELFPMYDIWAANNLSIKNNESFKNFIGEYSCPFDGKATDRIVKTITEHLVR